MMSFGIALALAAAIIAAYALRAPRGGGDWTSWGVGLVAGLLGAFAVFLMLNGEDVVYQIVTALMALVCVGTAVNRLRIGFADAAA